MAIPAAPAEGGPAFARGLQIMLGVGILASSVVFFFQTRDPTVLLFGVLAGAILWLVTWLTGLTRSGAFGQVRVKCRSCGALNLEDARYCSACGTSF